MKTKLEDMIQSIIEILEQMKIGITDGEPSINGADMQTTAEQLQQLLNEHDVSGRSEQLPKIECEHYKSMTNTPFQCPICDKMIGSQSQQLDKLITLNDFVDNVKDYVNESQSTERGLKLIFDYNDFLNQDIKEEMFTGENPLFPDFKNIMQSQALMSGIKKSFQKDSKGEFSVCVYRTVGKEYGISKRTTYVTSFHLKTVNDLVGKIAEYNSFNSHFGWRDVS